ncbi:uncharacterized protein TM35_000035260, partial [Trypanosoma theileri]
VCVRSSFPNSPSVDVDISSLYSKYELGADNVTFCFVASDVTFNGRRYVWSHDVREPFLPESDSAVAPSSNKLSVGAIVGIVIAVVVVVIVAVILFFVLRQRPQQEQEQPREKVQMDTVESQSTSKTTTVDITPNPLTTTTTTEVTTNSAVSRNTARSVQSGDISRNSNYSVYGSLSYDNASPSEGQMKETSAPLQETSAGNTLPLRTNVNNRGSERKTMEEGWERYELNRSGLHVIEKLRIIEELRASYGLPPLPILMWYESEALLDAIDLILQDGTPVDQYEKREEE